MKNNTIIDVLIEDIKTDQKLLEEADGKIQKAREEKSEIINRLKEYRRDALVLWKYVDEGKRTELGKLGFEFTESNGGLNPVASLALEIIVKSKDKQMTNDAFYKAYVSSFKNPEDAFGYSDFNIKCRPLYNSQRLLRKKGKDPKSSKEDIISLNDKVAQPAKELGSQKKS